jgi:prepilin-type N-terminal cleavage/methylation domain-containing protein
MQTTINARRGNGAALCGAAFTLIEMMIVLIILVVVIAIVIPVLGAARNAAKGAATKNLMANLQNAASSFQMSERRPPGFFSPKDMGSTENADRAFTAMQNILVDLSGGVVPTAVPLSPGEVVDVGPTAANTIRIDIREVGSSTSTKGIVNKGYWAPDQATWVAQGVASHVSSIPGHYQLPDVVDAWGNPVLAWVQDDVPGTPPFSAIDSTTRSRFYWNSNSGLLKSVTSGRGQQNQRSESLLGFDQNQGNLVLTMRGVLGHPGYHDNTPSPNTLPTAARGSLIMQSAGPNGVFLGIGERGAKVAGVAAGQGAIKYIADQDPLDNFDDILSASGN